MTIAANKALLRDMFQAINDNNFDALAPHPGFWQTREVVPPMHRIFADWRTTHTQQIAQGDTVFSYLAFEFTHIGPFAGVAPTGKRVTFEGCSIDQVRDGIVVEHNSTISWHGVLQQLGVPSFARWPVPTPRPLLGSVPAAAGDTAAQKRVLQGLPQAIGRGEIDEAALRNGVGDLMAEFDVIHSAFPDLQYEWVTLLAEGDLVGARGTLRGTHTGELWGFAPTGKAIAWDQFIFARIADGQVAACNGTIDWTSALFQFELFPA